MDKSVSRNKLHFLDDNYNEDDEDSNSSALVVQPEIIIQAIGDSQGQTVTISQSSISDLSDVNLTNVQDGQMLAWNETNGYFEAVSPFGKETTNPSKLGK